MREPKSQHVNPLNPDGKKIDWWSKEPTKGSPEWIKNRQEGDDADKNYWLELQRNAGVFVRDETGNIIIEATINPKSGLIEDNKE